MQSMATLWNYVRLLSGKSEAEAEGFKTDRALGLFVVSGGDDWHGWGTVKGVGARVGERDLGRVWRLGGVEGKG